MQFLTLTFNTTKKLLSLMCSIYSSSSGDCGGSGGCGDRDCDSGGIGDDDDND
jgi:hypothetical protein